MDAFSDPLVELVAVMKGTQVGWTDIVNNVAGYHIDQDPAPMLVLQPTVEMGEAWSKDRLAPMLRDTPCLEEKVSDAKSRTSGSTIRHKTFPGGHITVTGANSPSSLAMRPVRIVLADEIDRYPPSAGDEGDPVSLAYKRAETFWNRKLGAGSSPTIAGQSAIEERYEESDKRRYFVPCPHCGEHQYLKWSQIKWEDGDPSTAAYACEHCGTLWTDQDRHEAVSKGEWRATAPFTGIAGFHVPQFLSPWVSMEKMVKEWLSAQSNPARLKVFINTVLAETWKDRGEAPEWQRLYERAEDWKPGTCPAGVLFLTCGIDVQRNPARIEVAVWGWGRGLESWLVDHIILAGDAYSEEVWQKLDTVMAQAWPHESGADLMLSKVAIDSGYATTQVYAWARRQGPGKVIAVKGVEHGPTGVGVPKMTDVGHSRSKGRKRVYRGVAVWPVVGGIYKSEFYGFLRQSAPTRESGDDYPQGYVHLPKMTEETFKQLVSEQLVTKVVKHRRKTEWEKTRERNEQLDMRVYARAAAAVFGVDRFTEKHWDAMEAHLVPRTKAAAGAVGRSRRSRVGRSSLIG